MSQKKKYKADDGSGEPERAPGKAHNARDASDEARVPIEIVDSSGEAQGDEPAATPLERAEARVQELEDRVRRLQAEFLNDTKRMKRQAEEDRKYAIERVVLDLVTVFDALHMSRQATPNAEDAGVDAVTQGLGLLEKELLNVLGRHGVERMEPEGTPFDPSQHEALFVVEDPTREPGTVAQVMRPGFTLHGRVVRPAHVAVTKGDEPSEAGD